MRASTLAAAPATVEADGEGCGAAEVGAAVGDGVAERVTWCAGRGLAGLCVRAGDGLVAAGRGDADGVADGVQPEQRLLLAGPAAASVRARLVPPVARRTATTASARTTTVTVSTRYARRGARLCARARWRGTYVTLAVNADDRRETRTGARVGRYASRRRTGSAGVNPRRLRPAGDTSDMAAADPYDLDRFVTAQDAGDTYARALAELRQGAKVSHWMWFVFPQIAGLGHSPTARHFAVSSVEEARAYLAHPVLGPRLAECAGVVAGLTGRTAEQIFGGVDAVKLRSSMTLFRIADPGQAVFGQVLDRYYAGLPDAATEQLARS